MRSSTMTIVGARSAAWWRSFCAAKSIRYDLPEPWKCQTSPFRTRPSSVRRTIAFAPSYCWYRQTIFTSPVWFRFGR